MKGFQTVTGPRARPTPSMRRSVTGSFHCPFVGEERGVDRHVESHYE